VDWEKKRSSRVVISADELAAVARFFPVVSAGATSENAVRNILVVGTSTDQEGTGQV
jgi:hypothetical protein